jgi:superkiller protein 3
MAGGFVAMVCIALALPLRAQTAATVRTQAGDLIRDGKTADAIALLTTALTRDPTDSRAHNLLGIALSRDGRHDEAIAQFQQALQHDPHLVAAMKNLAMDELQIGRDADARAHFTTALASAPQDPAIHFGLGQLEYRARNYDRAVAHFESSGNLYLQNPVMLLQYAGSCLETNQPAKVAEALLSLPSGIPPPMHFAAGSLLAKAERYPEAASHFSLAKGEGVDPYDAGYNLALAHFKAGNYPSAIEAAKTLTQRGLAKTELYGLLAKAYEASGNTKDAYDSLRAATQLDPRDEGPYLDLVALCAEHENYDLALEIAGIGLRVNPSAYRLRVDQGIVLALLGRMDEAEKEFARAAEINPSADEAPLARAIALMELNRTAEAIDLLRQRRKLRDDNYQVSWHLAEALIKSGEGGAPETTEALKRSIALNPSTARTQFLLGKVLAQSGRTDEAIDRLETALRLDKENVAAIYQLAQAYRKRGDTARANELFAKVSQAKAEASEQQAGRRGLLRIVRDGSR